jgi:sugar lactone lactonase YvrE
VPTHSGKILTINIDDGTIATFATPPGRVLGIEFSDTWELYAADAYRGLLKISRDGAVTVLTNETSEGSPIRYANDLDITRDGVVYFSDASTKFGAEMNGGTLPASLLDLIEHGPHGRVLKYDPLTRQTTIVIEDRSYANGVALSRDDSYLLVAETGTYSVLKHWLRGAKAGQTEPLLENLPGFPDNINGNPDGTFWMGLVSPRSPVVDLTSGYPFLRKIIMRLPAAIRPKPQRYGFVMRFDGNGTILEVLQDPLGDYALVTGGIDVGGGRVVVTSLTEPRLGYLDTR